MMKLPPFSHLWSYRFQGNEQRLGGKCLCEVSGLNPTHKKACKLSGAYLTKN